MSAHMTEDQTLLQDAAERYLRDSYDSVSYTHLTLPTIYSV